MKQIIIIGAGLAGLSSAITLAKQGIHSCLISLQASERSQSVLAEGGINASLNTMGEQDSTEFHFADTMRGGCYLADPNAVENLTKNAPSIVRWLEGLGVPFNRTENDIALRNFGGQKRKRTAYAQSSTGKIIMTAVIDETRKWEAKGLIQRFSHHEFLRLQIQENVCQGAVVRDCYTGEILFFSGSVLLCTGGMNGIFPEMTTGTTQNTGDVTATVFAQGVTLGNLEMIQYHPTTIGISGKRCLITEATRGEGGRLYIMRNHQKWYFMEELYPELGNLMPRDVISRTMYFVRNYPDCETQVYLDLTGLTSEIWEKRLSDFREELLRYTGQDPKLYPIPVHEGIHYFMGGIWTDEHHQTSMKYLYSAGECCCQYHGANRLGGNSLLGALYGGRKSAETILENQIPESFPPEKITSYESYAESVSPVLIRKISEILLNGLGIVRNENILQQAFQDLKELSQERDYSIREQNRLLLAEAMLQSAMARKESRGANYREDYPQQDDNYQKTTLATWQHQNMQITFQALPERRTHANSV